MASTQCGWCGRHANMRPIAEAASLRGRTIYDVLAMCAYQCDYCNGINVGVAAGNASGYRSLDEWMEELDDKLLWEPKRPSGQQYEDVPPHIAGAASEAHECNSIGAHRAAVQLSRSVIEAAAKEKGISGGRLYDKIEELFKRRLVREHVRDAAHEIRHLGNDMAHGDFVEPIDPVEAEEILSLMDEVLDEVFQSPARVERRRQARLAKKAGGGAAGS